MKENRKFLAREWTAGIFAMAIALTGTGCGESFDGTFKGEAVLQDNCDYQSGKYKAEFHIRVSGNEIELLINSLTSLDGTSKVSVGNLVSQIGPVTASLESNTNFYAKDAEGKVVRGTIDVDGTLNAARDEITLRKLAFSTFRKDNSACSVSISSEKLKIQQ